MQEFIGLAYFAEIPAVIFDVQRSGPSTGMPTRTQQTDIIICAYACHGDTKHVLLFPEDPYECFEFGALAFDLADRLQTPVFVMLDLEIGMNERLTKPFTWDDTRKHGPRQGDDRGRSGSGQEVRPLSGCGWRRHPVSHLSRHASDQGRLLHPRHLEGPHGALFRRRAGLPGEHGAAAEEAPHRAQVGAAGDADEGGAADQAGRDLFRLHQPGDDRGRRNADQEQGIPLDLLRVRGFPFADEVEAFIAEHDKVFVVEQNRDGQLRMLLMNELEINPAKLVKILHYDGTPITARFIAGAIGEKLESRQNRSAA